MMRIVALLIVLSLVPAVPGFSETTGAAVDSGGRAEPLPKDLENVGIMERPNEKLPLDLLFTDESGEAARLGDFFGERPVLLNLGYYTCPMLCGLVLNGILEALKSIDWTPGKEFEIVTVSIDPSETSTLARLKKENTIEEYGRAGAAKGWHFLVGEEEEIRALTDAAGFRYAYDEERGEYIHAAVIIVCTPDGRLSRYLYGVLFDSQTLRLSLLEASEGKIGSPLDRILLYCYHYDAARGRYAPAALNIMRAGGALAVVVLGITLAALWRRDAGRRPRA
ncbi:MAG: SCO family protein [Candidatus Eisenbacteria bacterium]|nr:SCO family protein [Candidatus Eisenbacteria bacterium]